MRFIGTFSERGILGRKVIIGGAIIASTVTVASRAEASTAPVSFTYQGKIYNASGSQPLQSGAVTFTLQLRSPDGQCLLFEEKHTRNMTGTGGVFSLNVGEGTNTGRTALNLLQVIDNTDAKTGDASCSYQPVAGDTRRIRLLYDEGSGDVTFPTDQMLRSVPYAMNSSTLQGMAKDKFIQVSTQITQSKVEQLLTYFSTLIDLAQGNSTTYAKTSDLPISGGVLNLATGGVKVADSPAAANYAVNRNYVDARIAGSTVDLTGLGNGQTMVWNAAMSKWTVGYSTLPNAGTAGTYTKVTTDAQGRVVSGTTLAASDIPAPGGDLSGSHAATTVQRIQGVMVSTTAPTTGQVLTYNSLTSKWEPATPTVGTVTTVTASAPLNVSNSTTTPNITLAAGSASGQVLNWSGSAWSSAYPNMNQLRGVAAVPQFPTSCTAGQTLVYYSPADRYDCTDIAIASSRVSGLGGAALLNVGTTSGTVAAGDDSRLVNAVQTSSVAGGDIAGSWASLSVQKIRGIGVSSATPTTGQILKYDSTSGTFIYAADNNSGGTITSLTPGVGFTSATAITSAGTLNINVGTGANQIVQLDNNGRLPALDATNLTNLPSVSASSITGLGGGALLNVGTASGTVAAGNDARMVNAVQTSTTAAGDISGTWSTTSVQKIRGITVSSATPTNGQILKYDSTSSTFLYASDVNSGGTVTSLTPGTGFTSATAITGSGTLNVNVGTGANQIVQLDSGGKLPALDASNLTNFPTISNSNISGLGGAALLNVGTASGTVAAGNDARMVNAVQTSTTAAGDISGTWSTTSVQKIRGITVSSATPTNGQILKYDSTSSTFLYASDVNSGGTVTSITPGTGFTSTTAITGTGTLNLNIGTTAGSVAAGDDSRLVNAVQSSSTAAGDITGTWASLNVQKIQGISISTSTPTSGQILTYNSSSSVGTGDSGC